MEVLNCRKTNGENHLADLVGVIKRFESSKDEENKNTTSIIGPSVQNNSETQIEQGLKYLEKKCSTTVGFQCKVGKCRKLNKATHTPIEVFSSAIIQDLIRDTNIDTSVPESLTKFIKSSMNPETGTFNFFKDRSIMPDDVDDTAVCLWALLTQKAISIDKASAIAEVMVQNNQTPNGVIEIFLPPYGCRGGRLDVIALCNVMRVLYFLGMDSEAKATEDFIFERLEKKSDFEDGYLYYHSPDAFLYFLANTFSLSERAKGRFSELLKTHLIQSFGTSSYPLDLAMRLITAHKINLADDPKYRHLLEPEIHLLRSVQYVDGSWDRDTIYRYKGFYFGSRAITTAFAVKALQLYS